MRLGRRGHHCGSGREQEKESERDMAYHGTAARPDVETEDTHVALAVCAAEVHVKTRIRCCVLIYEHIGSSSCAGRLLVSDGPRTRKAVV